MTQRAHSYNICPAALRLYLMIAVFLNVLGPQSATAAICSTQTNFTCKLTDFTLQTCSQTTQSCDCLSGFEPIPTGCTETLKTPTIKVGDGRLQQLVPGTTGRLTCDNPNTGTVKYQWMKDGVPVATTDTPVYMFTATGNFSCLVNDTALALVSEESSTVKITQADITKVIPKMGTLPKEAAVGVELDLTCIDIPYGATYTFQVNSGVQTTATVKQDPANTLVACVLNDTSTGPFPSKKSAAVTWTTASIADIRSVTIVPSASLVIKTGTSLTFTCSTIPDRKFMEFGTTKIIYTFQDTGNSSAKATDNTYTMTSLAGDVADRDISCNATFGSNPAQSSEDVIVQPRDDYIQTPILNVSETSVKVGSRLVLTCGAAQTVKIVTYGWTKDGASISRQYDRVIQYGSFQPSDAGTFSCTAQTGLYQATSDEKAVRSSALDAQVLTSTILLILATTVSGQVL